MFTLRQRPAGITLCSHWLNPLLPLHGLHIFPVLQDFKKRTEGDKERKREKREREKPFPPIICGFSLASLCVCVCVKGEDSCINRNTNSRTTNSSEACGLQTHFYTGHMVDAVPLVSNASHSSCWITGDRSYWMWPQFGNANYKVCTCGYTAQIGSYGACKMHESSKLNQQMKKQKNSNKIL